jgi:calmodulin
MYSQGMSGFGMGYGHGGRSPHGSRSGTRGGLAPSTYSGMFGQRLTSRLTPQEKELIDVAFESFKNEQNLITTEGLQEAFRQIMGAEDEADIQMLIDDIDENGDGSIDEEEFRHIMTKKFLGEDNDSSMVHSFEMFDKDKDGHIPATELRTILMTEGQAPLTENECDELLMFADLDGDGLVEYKSFLRWISNPEAPGPQRM